MTIISKLYFSPVKSLSFQPVNKCRIIKDIGIFGYVIACCLCLYLMVPYSEIAPLFYADPMGAIIGKTIESPKIWENKTLAGTSAIFGTSLLTIDGNIEDKIIAEEFSNNFVSCKRLDSLLENYNEKEVNVIGKRLLQDLPNELHKELLEKNAGNALSPRFSEKNIDIILICDRKDDIGIQVNREVIAVSYTHLTLPTKA